jgi:GntR family transcriptional repressor for pyruvate dehydrogenase complex
MAEAQSAWEAKLGIIEPQRTFEQIVELITDRMHAREIKPGDRLPPERTLATQLRVGRPAVREAYRALELIGILEIRKGKQGGAFVRSRDQRSVTQTLDALIRVDGTGLRELTEARLALERSIVELAVRRCSRKDLARLRACTDLAMSQSQLGITATDENLRFHVLLGEISGNAVLALLLGSMLDLLRIEITRLAPAAGISLEVAEEHHPIIDALEARDAVRVGKLLEEHILSTNRALIRLANKERKRNGSEKADGRRAGHRRRALRP